VYDDAALEVTFLSAAYDHDAVERDARRGGYRIPRARLAWDASKELARQLAVRAGVYATSK